MSIQRWKLEGASTVLVLLALFASTLAAIAATAPPAAAQPGGLPSYTCATGTLLTLRGDITTGAMPGPGLPVTGAEFDDQLKDQGFAHTETLPAGQTVVAGRMAIALQSNNGGNDSATVGNHLGTTGVDRTRLYLPGQGWGQGGNGNPFSTQIFDLAAMPLNAGNNAIDTGPVDLLAGITAHGAIDFYMQDDHGINFVQYDLCVIPTTPVVECPSGLNVLFVIDNSGSIDSSEFALFTSSAETIGDTLLGGTGDVKVAVAHYALAALSVERDFADTPMSLSSTKGPGLDNGDDLAFAMDHFSDMLDNGSSPSVLTAGSLATLNPDPAFRTHIVVMTDGDWGAPPVVSSGSYLRDLRPTASYDWDIYDSIKSSGKAISVVRIQQTNGAGEVAAIASPGGTWTTPIAVNPLDPQPGASPRRYWPTASFDVAAVSNDIAQDVVADCNLDLEKLTNGSSDSSQVLTEGDAVTWTYTVTNNSSASAITNIQVVDDQEGAVCTIATLAPGASQTCTLSGVAVPGVYTNVATVTGDLASFGPVNAVDQSGYVGAALCNGQLVTIDMNLGASGIGTPQDDVILGTPGDDVINALDGADTVCAGDGEDTVTGGPGVDWVDGGTGDDTVRGGGGADTLYGGDGDDFIDGQGGSDTIYGEAGEDTIRGRGAADTIFGGADNDTIDGHNGIDIIDGGDGDDTIKGQTGPDELTGDAGNDLLLGGNGNDTLYGGSGTDRCAGNLGPADRAEGATCETIPSIEIVF